MRRARAAIHVTTESLVSARDLKWWEGSRRLCPTVQFYNSNYSGCWGRTVTTSGPALALPALVTEWVHGQFGQLSKTLIKATLFLRHGSDYVVPTSTLALDSQRSCLCMSLPRTGIKGMGHYAGLKPVFIELNFKNWNDSSVFSVLIDLCSFPGPHVKKKYKSGVIVCAVGVEGGGLWHSLANQPWLLDEFQTSEGIQSLKKKKRPCPAAEEWRQVIILWPPHRSEYTPTSSQAHTGLSSVGEHLPGMCDTLHSIPRTSRKDK